MKKNTSIWAGLILSLTVTLSLSACVSTSEFEAMMGQRDMVIKEREALKTEMASLAEQLDNCMKETARLDTLLAETEQEKLAAAEKAAQAEAELAKQQDVYSRLQSTFAQEQAANQVKIEMLKSGIKVNLANEILFSSGSAILNKQGQEVLKRAAGDLKDSPYQILVAGFTDNVAISGNLKKTFPTNWELAGARAASVVRILEEQGIPSEQLLLISLGENQPVESNDTPAGRAKNRRIEIMLRPVPVTLD